MPLRPLGDRPMTNAERQARHRAARAAAQPAIVELDLDELTAIVLPRGFGRD